MASKSLKILSLSIFTLLVLASFVSAAITFSDQNPTTLTQESGTFDINVTSDSLENITFSVDEITDYNGKTITFNPIDAWDDSNMGPQTITINYVIDSEFDFFGKEYSTILTADGDVSNNATKTLTFEQTPFYDGENEAEIKISELDFNTMEGFGDDEDYWYPLDEVEIKFNVENKGDWDVENIEIKACLWDEERGKCIFDEDDMEIDDDKFDLDSGDDKDVTLTLKVDADELKAGNNDYTFYVKAVGKIDDKDADESDGDETGDSDSQPIEIITDDKFVIIDDIELQPSSVSCGQTVELTAKAWNVGDEDLDDDEVYVQIYNKELGIDKTIEFSSGIDAMDSEKISFSFEIPKDIEEGTYVIKLIAYNDEDMDDNDVFKTDDKEDEASYFGTLEITEDSCVIEPQVSVFPSLESEAKAGEDLIVKATITNTGDKLSLYKLNIADYNEWATLVDVEPSTVILDAGDSQDVLITLNVNKDVSGDKLFNIEVLSDDEIVITQPVSTTIEEQSGLNFPGITGNLISGNNWYLWGIGALNVILIIIIIIVALRVAKKE
ncbi:MAG: putative S-layer protein [Candidatus Thorarchaeota archaeon]